MLINFMEIVNAQAAHIAQIYEIEKANFSSPWSLDALRSQLNQDRYVFLAAVDEGEVLGYVGLMFVLDEGYISNIAVSENHRRKHIADLLISALEESAREKGLSFMSLEVRESNTPARRLYEKHGFKDVGLRKRYYCDPMEDAVISSKEL